MQKSSLYEHFDIHQHWREDFIKRLAHLVDWLKQNDLLDAGVEARLSQVRNNVGSDKVMVAFVAEFSRGKSELINSLFFAEYGRRIMPASAGRTTMCPTELSYDAGTLPCLRLLPIETRLEAQTLMDWRLNLSAWKKIELDVNDPDQLALAMERVSEVINVSKARAKDLGFWHDDGVDNPPVNADGEVEVPKWRHAQINMEHHLLAQGLVILDTPGLNAIGAEPELTLNLIPQAHAIVFILAADTGVTKSDLTMWKDHLQAAKGMEDSRLVVLNKIDTMWDALSTSQSVAMQIERQCEDTAKLLELRRDQVIPVSAHKGLLAKVTNDDALLKASRLAELETALTRDILGKRQNVLGEVINAAVTELQQEVGRIITLKRRDVAEQKLELNGLMGKNAGVVRQMRLRIDQEKAEFDTSAKKIFALRSVHLKSLKDLFAVLSNQTLKEEMLDLEEKLDKGGLKFGVKTIYADFFVSINEKLEQAYKITIEIQDMLLVSFRQLNAEYGFNLQLMQAPDIARLETELDDIERTHQQYLGLSNAIRLAEPEYARRLVQSLYTRLILVFEKALNEIETWNKSTAAQLDGQVREKKESLEKRSQSVGRIQEATTNLEERIQEVDTQLQKIMGLESHLEKEATALLMTQQ